MIQRVSVRRKLVTRCPADGRTDVNDVVVAWRWAGQRIDAEAIHRAVDAYADRKEWAEDLADWIAHDCREIVKTPVEVTLTQDPVWGHGVSVVANTT